MVLEWPPNALLVVCRSDASTSGEENVGPDSDTSDDDFEAGGSCHCFLNAHQRTVLEVSGK